MPERQQARERITSTHPPAPVRHPDVYLPGDSATKRTRGESQERVLTRGAHRPSPRRDGVERGRGMSDTVVVTGKVQS